MASRGRIAGATIKHGGRIAMKEFLKATKAPLSELKSAVLRAVHQHTKKGLTHDDVTLIALEIC